MGNTAEISATAMLPASTYGNTLKRGTTGAWKLTRPIQAATPTPTKKPSDRADCSQGGGFGGKESVDQPLGCAQRLHDGKVAAAVKDPSDQRREHAQRGGQNDQRGAKLAAWRAFCSARSLRLP